MTAMQDGNVSAYDVHERLRTGPEDVARFLAESGTGYETPGAEPDLRAFGNGGNAPQQPRFAMVTRRKWVPSGDPNAQSSGKARAFDAYGRFHLPESRRLSDALAELAEVDDEIAEENLPQVGEATKTEAERLVRALTGRAPACVLLAVYPTQDAEIALHFKAPDRPDAVLVLLRDGGRADCHAYVGGTSRRAHYNTSSDLPDAFVLDQLRCLTPPSRAAVSTPDAGFLQFGTGFLSANLLQTR